MRRQEAIAFLLNSPTLKETEKKFLMEVQLCPESASHFWGLLWDAMLRADADNLALLRKGFPEEVAAVEAWKHGNLSERGRACDPKNVLGI